MNKLGVEYFLIFKNCNEKKAIVVPLGRGFVYGVNAMDEVAKMETAIHMLNEALEDDKILELDDVELQKLTVGHIARIKEIIDLLNGIKYSEIVSYGSIMLALRLFGVVNALKYSCYGKCEWELVSEYELSKNDIIEKLKDEGFEVYVWGL